MKDSERHSLEPISINVGDYLFHADHGEGWVTWINSNPNAVCPIKIHFPEKQFYLLVGRDLKEYPDLKYHKFSCIMRYKQT